MSAGRTACGAGGVAQAASRHASPAAPMDDNGRTRIAVGREALGWVFLEIALALAIAVAIVWWTLPRKPRRGGGKDGGGEPGP